MLEDFPTAIETKKCSNGKCRESKNIQNNIMFLTYQVNNSQLFEGLQTFISNRILSENSKWRLLYNNIDESIGYVFVYWYIILGR